MGHGFYANNVGIIAGQWMNTSYELTDDIIEGGTGCFPLDVHNEWEFDVATGVLPAPQVAREFQLFSSHPNPFNPTTVLSFELRAASLVRLEVFDINGRVVGAHGCAPTSGSGATPTMYAAGSHQIAFDGTHLPSGIYFAKLTAGEFTQVQKLVLLK